jgi:hypothetical protein
MTRKPVNPETIEGTLAVSDSGRRHLNLNRGERDALLRQRTIERAVTLFLDLETDRTWTQIAAELDMSVSALKRFSQAPDFISVYEDTLATVGHDPRLQAVTSSLGDLLPAARRRLQSLLTSADTPAGVALKAIEKLFEWTGADEQREMDDPNALRNFLGQHGVQVQGDLQIINMSIPVEYQQAFGRFLGGNTDIIDGEARTIDSADHVPADEAGGQLPVDELSDEAAQPGQ